MLPRHTKHSAMADRSQAIALKEEIPDADAGGGRAGARVRPRGEPRAVHQPRVVVAAFQPPGARGGRERRPSAARARALPVDLRQQSRRVLHGARRRPQGPAARGHHRSESRTGSRRPSSSPASRRRSSALASDQQKRWRELRADAGRAGHRAGRRAGRDEEGEDLARGSFPAPDLSRCSRRSPSIPAHPFPFIPNLGFTIALQLARVERRQGDECADPHAATRSSASSACRARTARRPPVSSRSSR